MENVQQLFQTNIVKNNDDGEIFMPNWLVEVFEFIKRSQLIDSPLSYTCRIFSHLCMPKLHGNVKPHFIPRIVLRKHFFKSGKNRIVLSTQKFCCNPWNYLPIPLTRPPEYILGFQSIELRHFEDPVVIEFVQCILHLLNNCQLVVKAKNRWTTKWVNRVNYLLEMLIPRANSFTLQIYSRNLTSFNQIFSGKLFKVQKLSTDLGGMNFDLLFEWLKAPREAGQKPRELEILFSNGNKILNFIDLVKEEFSGSTQPVNYSIVLLPAYLFHFNFEPFTMQNERTGEMLEMENRIIFRHPINNKNIFVEPTPTNGTCTCIQIENTN